jgi:hypothetical protein
MVCLCVSATEVKRVEEIVVGCTALVVPAAATELRPRQRRSESHREPPLCGMSVFPPSTIVFAQGIILNC